MDPWVDYTDPDVIAKITGDPAVTDGVYESIAAASEILTSLTGFRGHSAGTTTQEYILRDAYQLIRLTPAYRPVVELRSVDSISDNCISTTDVTHQFCVFAGDIRRTGPWTTAQINVCNECSQRHQKLRVEYSFGSTVGTAARRAVITMSRQLWLSEHPESGECILPERVVSLNREGLSYSFIDPMTFLDRGRTGIPSVDMYLSTVNPSGAKAPAAVYIPEAPPGVIR